MKYIDMHCDTVMLAYFFDPEHHVLLIYGL